MKILFWFSFFYILYGYFVYPLVLYLLLMVSKGRSKTIDSTGTPDDKFSVSVIMPVYNGEAFIQQKLNNLSDLQYQRDKIEFIIVSDGSDDRTNEILNKIDDQRFNVIIKNERTGKADTLNHGLKAAQGEILVFCDASIMIQADAIRKMVRHFENPLIGCVSGKDIISEHGGEGLYGRYELFLRDLESGIFSITGASGSLYAQRKMICGEFRPGMAPDFMSVLETIEQGYRAISENEALGYMKEVANPKDEFNRKTRTVLRGITTMFYYKHLLNPLKYPMFSFILFSHKIVRWTIPFALIVMILSNLALITLPFYKLVFLVQCLFYGLTLISFVNKGQLRQLLPVKISIFFTLANYAVLVAWIKYLMGYRQEIWDPSKR